MNDKNHEFDLPGIARPYTVELWICLNCAYPCWIEDGGFYPEANYVKNGGHPAGFRIECGLCCHDEYVKIDYKATIEGMDLWHRRRTLLKSS